ncbi:MAG: DUF1150 family protein [Dongiaceae bacterium]
MNTAERIRQISVRDLAVLGLQDMAYVKPVTLNNRTGFAIHAADGSSLAMAETRDIAFATVRQNGLEPVSVH